MAYNNNLNIYPRPLYIKSDIALLSPTSLDKNHVYKKAMFFVDTERYAINYGVMNDYGRPIWSTEIYGLSYGWTENTDVYLSNDNQGYLIAVVNDNIIKREIKIFPNAVIPDKDNPGKIMLTVTDEGQLIQRIKDSSGKKHDVFKTPEDISLPQNLRDTLELDLRSDPNVQVIISPDQLLKSADGRFRIEIQYDDTTEKVKPVLQEQDTPADLIDAPSEVGSNGSFGC
ncbi:MAG: hypothetical protein AAF228_02220 [Pseudomonadota bacterium]